MDYKEQRFKDNKATSKTLLGLLVKLKERYNQEILLKDLVILRRNLWLKRNHKHWQNSKRKCDD